MCVRHAIQELFQRLGMEVLERVPPAGNGLGEIYLHPQCECARLLVELSLCLEARKNQIHAKEGSAGPNKLGREILPQATLRRPEGEDPPEASQAQPKQAPE